MNGIVRPIRRSSAPAWSELRPGKHVSIAKLAPDGSEAARYEGEVISMVDPESWCVARAIWNRGDMTVDGLGFHPGDHLLEWFSPVCWFNAFAVFAPDGGARGWYANVTYPAHLIGTEREPTLVWHDLYLDLVCRADGSHVTRDRDELDASGISESDPQLYRAILKAMNELVARYEQRQIPFRTGVA